MRGSICTSVQQEDISNSAWRSASSYRITANKARHTVSQAQHKQRLHTCNSSSLSMFRHETCSQSATEDKSERTTTAAAGSSIPLQLNAIEQARSKSLTVLHEQDPSSTHSEQSQSAQSHKTPRAHCCKCRLKQRQIMRHTPSKQQRTIVARSTRSARTAAALHLRHAQSRS